VNIYEYVQSNPVNHVDPYGLKRFVAIMHGQNFFGLDGGAAFGVMNDVYGRLKGDPDNIVKIFSEDADNSDVVINWIKSQKNVYQFTKCEPIIALIGHSNGGDAARKLTTKSNRIPEEEGWDVELLFTVDPVGKPWHSWNSTQPIGSIVKKAINYYQRHDKFGSLGFKLQGYRLQGAENYQWKLDPGDSYENSIINTPILPHMAIMADGGSGFSSKLQSPSQRTTQRIKNEVSNLPK